MTGYTVNTGSSVKFSAGWDQIFKGKKSGSKPSPRPSPATSKKSVGKKAAKKKR